MVGAHCRQMCPHLFPGSCVCPCCVPYECLNDAQIVFVSPCVEAGFAIISGTTAYATYRTTKDVRDLAWCVPSCFAVHGMQEHWMRCRDNVSPLENQIAHNCFSWPATFPYHVTLRNQMRWMSQWCSTVLHVSDRFKVVVGTWVDPMSMKPKQK